VLSQNVIHSNDISFEEINKHIVGRNLEINSASVPDIQIVLKRYRLN
jgi:hypothetical protein